MAQLIKINKQNLPVKEYNGQRVVTFKEIDTVHGRPSGSAHRNFKANRKRFIEGVDYFRRNSSEAKSEYGITAPNGLVLLTESGYLMLAKSFTDDLAWTVQRELVNCYFRVKSEKGAAKRDAQPEQLTLDTSEYHYVDKTYNGEPVITLTDFEHFTGINHDTARSCMRTCCIKGKDYEVLTGYNLASFKVENYGFARGVKSIIILRKSAVQRLLDFYKCTANIAMLKTAEKKPVQKQLTQAKRKFSAAEHIIALEILNNLRLDFQEDLNNPTCIYPEVVKKNIKAIDTAIDYVAMPLAAGIR